MPIQRIVGNGNKLLLIGFLCICGTGASCLASYYENWIVEGSVLEVYDEKATAKILKENRNIQVLSKKFIGLKIRLNKCEYQEGHGKMKCREDQVRVIVMGYDSKAPKGGFKEDMVLRIRYFYSDGAVPAGEPASSNVWQLVKVKDKENPL